MAEREHIKHQQFRNQCIGQLAKLPGRMNRPIDRPTFDEAMNTAHQDGNIDALYDRAWEMIDNPEGVAERDLYYAYAITMIYEEQREQAGE